jgi:hypothetical protein
MNFRQLNIKPKTAADSDLVLANITKNMALIENWIPKCAINGDTAVILSAGNSLEKYVETFPRTSQPEEKYFTVKHALPRLRALDIIPDYCVLLDGRSSSEESTHGHNRLALLEGTPKSTVFLVASMACPGYTEWLLNEGYTVFGWHALTEEIKRVPTIRSAISGGTSSSMRSLGISWNLGFRKAQIYAVDSSYQEEPAVKKPTDVQVHIRTNKEDPTDEGISFWTSYELCAQAQDFEKLLKDETSDIQVKIYADGMVGAMIERLPNKTIKPYYWDIEGLA